MASLGKALSKFAASLTAEDIMGLAMAAGGLSAIRGVSSAATGARANATAKGLEGKNFANGIPQSEINKIISDSKETMPSSGLELNYQVNFVRHPKGENEFNARLSKDAKNYAVMQTESEHNDAINYFLKRLPRNPTLAQVNQAIRQGVRKEQELKKFWIQNKTLRKYISPSSSAVSMVKIDPSNNIIVHFGDNPTDYTYRGGANPLESSRIAAELVTADSIGHAINTWWGDAHRIKGFKG